MARRESDVARSAGGAVGEFERAFIDLTPPVKVLAAVRSSVPAPSRMRLPAPALAPVPPEPV